MSDILDTLDTLTEEMHAEQMAAGFSLPETAIQRADLNLKLAQDMNPEQEAAALRESARTGKPLPFVRASDNRQMNTVDIASLNPRTQDFLAQSVSNAAVVKDDVPAINDIIDVANFGNMSSQRRMEHVRGRILRNGYTKAELADLAKMGYRPVDPKLDTGAGALSDVVGTNVVMLNREKEGILFSRPDGKGGIEYTRTPILADWYMGESERQATVKNELDAVSSDGAKVDYTRLTPETLRSMTETLVKEITVMSLLNERYPQWRDYSPEDLKKSIDEVGASVGLTSGDIDMERLGKRSFGKETRWSSALDLFGANTLMKGSPDLAKLETTAKDMKNASNADLGKLVEFLEEQRDALRGATKGTQYAEGALDIAKFATELWVASVITGGVGGAMGLAPAATTTTSLKGLPFLTKAKTVLGMMGSSAAKGLEALPFYLPSLLGKGSDSLGIFQVNGKIVTDLQNASESEEAVAFVNGAWDQAIELVSERFGELIPGFSAGGKVFTKLIPQRVKSSAVAQAFASAYGKAAKSKFAHITNQLRKQTATSGYVGERFEEIVGDELRNISTKLAEAFGTKIGNVGYSDDVFGSVDHEAMMFANLATMPLLTSIPQNYGAVRAAMKVPAFLDAQRALHRAVEASKTTQRSPATVEEAIRQQTGSADTVYISPEDAGVLFQSNPELMENIGVDEDIIGAAEMLGERIPISMARVHTHTSEADAEAIMSKVIIDPKHAITVEQAEKVDLSDEAQKAAEEKARDREETRKAYDEAISQLKALGRPSDEIRAAAKLLSMAEYFGEHSEMKAADWIRNVAFQRMKEEDWLREHDDARGGFAQTFGVIRAKLPVEAGSPLLAVKGNLYPTLSAAAARNGGSTLLQIRKAYDALPDSVSDPWGNSVYLKLSEGKRNRLAHFITQGGRNENEVRDSIDYNKVKWLPRVAETVQGAQVRLVDHRPDGKGRHNYAYVRRYAEGLHVVITTQDGVFIGQVEYDTAAITQFGEDAEATTARNNFSVDRKGKGIPQAKTQSAASYAALAPAEILSEYDPTTPVADDNIYPTLEEVKSALEKNYARGVTQFDPNADTTSFNDSWKAIVTLFDGAADASTLVHEIGHYAYLMMDRLVQSGMADQRMTDDFNKLTKWASDGVADPAEMKEKLAKGFERYVMEGDAPSAELTGAFSTLRRLMLAVYNSVKALGINLTDEVRDVFDGMLKTDQTVERDSLLRETVSMLNTEFINLLRSGNRNATALMEKANTQALEELIAEKNRQLKELRPQWRKEADELMVGEPVYDAWKAIRKEGGIDFAGLVETVGEYMAIALRNKGLTTAPGRRTKDGKYPQAKAGKHPATFAASAGYTSIERMVDELYYAKSPDSFVKEYMSKAEADFHEQFEMTEAAQSVQATADLLDYVTETIALKGGVEFSRAVRREAKRRARERVDNAPVREILRNEKTIGDCRSNAKRMVEAINKGDYIKALDAAQKLQGNFEYMRQKAEAKKEIHRVEKLLRRGRHAKKIRGEYQEAIIDLSRRFGFTGSTSKKLRHSVESVVNDYNATAEANGENILDVPEALLFGRANYRAIKFSTLQQLHNLASFLYGEGKRLVSEMESGKAQKVTDRVKRAVSELFKNWGHKHYVDDPKSFAYKRETLIALGSKLRNMFDMAGKWADDSVFKEMYDELSLAASEETQLMTDPAMRIRRAAAALLESSKNWDLSSIADIYFPDSLASRKYTKWDAEKVVCACLNMGTFTNRQRLIDGYSSDRYTWSEDTLDRIASVLSVSDWEQIQKIWDAINTGNLAERTLQTFKDVYHYDLPVEEAEEFTVNATDGIVKVAGGYYPLDYLFHKNAVAETNTESESSYISPEYRKPSFSYERNKKVSDPVKLSLSLVYEHVNSTAHYASHFEKMRQIMRVIKNPEFRQTFQEKQGFARYKYMKAILDNIAAPGEWMNGQINTLERWSRSILYLKSLGLNMSSVAKQLSGLTVGIEEVGSANWLQAAVDIFSSYGEMYEDICTKSGMMRDRVNFKDVDMREAVARFDRSNLEKTKEFFSRVAMKPLQALDFAVAAPGWLAAYRKASVEEGKSEREAVAIADEFTAKTQGASRPIDLSPAQLDSVGRVFTVFFSTASAVSTYRINKIAKFRYTKQWDLGFFINTLAIPIVVNALAVYLFTGGDDKDPDMATKQFLSELAHEPFSGMIGVREMVDAITAVLSGRYQTDVVGAGSLDAVSDLFKVGIKAGKYATEGNVAGFLYNTADLAGTFFGLPAVGIYDRVQRQFNNAASKFTGADVELLPDIEEMTKSKRKRRR